MNIAIPVGFLILAVILLWYFINTKGSLATKIGLTLLAGYYSLVTWHSLGSYEGWPSSHNPPEEFVLHWATAVEPSKITHDPGAIYIWITGTEVEANTAINFLGRKSDKTEPRAFKLPYSTELHEKIEKARNSIKKGKIVRGKKGTGPLSNGDNDPKGRPNNSKTRSLSNEQELEFHELLPSVLPDKQ